MTAGRNLDRSDSSSVESTESTAIRFLRTAAVQTYPLDDELVLYDERDGRSYVLNRTGAAIWRLCDGEKTVDDLVTSIAREYAQPVEQVRLDVEALLTELAGAGLLLAGG